MKKIMKSAALISTVSLLAACGADDITKTQSPQNYHDIKTTFKALFLTPLMVPVLQMNH